MHGAIPLYIHLSLDFFFSIVDLIALSDLCNVTDALYLNKKHFNFFYKNV